MSDSSNRGPRSDGNKEVLCIPQSSSITGASPFDCWVSFFPGHLFGESYSSAEMQLAYSTAPAEWVIWKWMSEYDWNSNLLIIMLQPSMLTTMPQEVIFNDKKILFTLLVGT